MPATMAALIVSRLKGGWRRFMNSCSWPLESVRTEYVMSGDGMPCIMPPRPSEPWHMAHPTPAMPWLFSTTRPPEVVPCRKMRRPLSVWDTGAGVPPPVATAPSSRTTAMRDPLRARMSDYVCRERLLVKQRSRQRSF